MILWVTVSVSDWRGLGFTLRYSGLKFGVSLVLVSDKEGEIFERRLGTFVVAFKFV